MKISRHRRRRRSRLGMDVLISSPVTSGHQVDPTGVSSDVSPTTTSVNRAQTSAFTDQDSDDYCSVEPADPDCGPGPGSDVPETLEVDELSEEVDNLSDPGDYGPGDDDLSVLENGCGNSAVGTSREIEPLREPSISRQVGMLSEMEPSRQDEPGCTGGSGFSKLPSHMDVLDSKEAENHSSDSKEEAGHPIVCSKLELQTQAVRAEREEGPKPSMDSSEGAESPSVSSEQEAVLPTPSGGEDTQAGREEGMRSSYESEEDAVHPTADGVHNAEFSGERDAQNTEFSGEQYEMPASYAMASGGEAGEPCGSDANHADGTEVACSMQPVVQVCEPCVDWELRTYGDGSGGEELPSEVEAEISKQEPSLEGCLGDRTLMDTKSTGLASNTEAQELAPVPMECCSIADPECLAAVSGRAAFTVGEGKEGIPLADVHDAEPTQTSHWGPECQAWQHVNATAPEDGSNAVEKAETPEVIPDAPFEDKGGPVSSEMETVALQGATPELTSDEGQAPKKKRVRSKSSSKMDFQRDVVRRSERTKNIPAPIYCIPARLERDTGKAKIRVGSDHQAVIPELLSPQSPGPSNMESSLLGQLLYRAQEVDATPVLCYPASAPPLVNCAIFEGSQSCSAVGLMPHTEPRGLSLQGSPLPAEAPVSSSAEAEAGVNSEAVGTQVSRKQPEFTYPPHQDLCREVYRQLEACQDELSKRHQVMDATVLQLDRLVGQEESDMLGMTTMGSRILTERDVEDFPAALFVEGGSSCQVPSPVLGWSTEDEERFAVGVRRHDRRFHIVQKQYLPHKSMNQIISYYYNIWKIRYTEDSRNWHSSRKKKKRPNSASRQRS